MCKCFKSSFAFFLVMTFLISCSSANNKPLSILLSEDSSSIIFRNIDPAGLLQLKNMANVGSAYGEILSVSELPAENDSLSSEHSFPGKVVFTDTSLVFTPVHSFTPGKSYLVICYLNARFGNPSMMLTGKMSHGVKPAQVILKR